MQEDGLARKRRELIDRMKKIEGQTRGIQRMLEEGEHCEAIIIQLAAIKSAVNRVGLSLIGCHLGDALRREEEGADDAVNEAVRILAKF